MPVAFARLVKHAVAKVFPLGERQCGVMLVDESIEPTHRSGCYSRSSRLFSFASVVARLRVCARTPR